MTDDHSTDALMIQGIIDNVPQGLISMDDQGGIQWVNQMAASIFGYESRELVGGNISLLMPEVGREKIGYVQRSKKTGTAGTRGQTPEQVTGVRQDGSTVELEVSIGEGATVGTRRTFVALIRDIDAARDVEAQLRRSDDRFRAHMEGSLDAIFLMQAVRDQFGKVIDFTFTDANERGIEFVDFTREQLIGGRLCELMPDNITNGLFDLYKGVFESGKPVDEELAVNVEGVSAQWVHFQIVPIINGIAFHTRDITERKLTEEALLSASELSTKIISESPIGIAIYDQIGQCIRVNKSIAEMVGATQEQLLEQNYNTIESWVREGIVDKIQRSIHHQEKVRFEFKISSSFGKQTFFDWYFVPFSSHGEQHLLLLLDDISARKEMETALKDSEALLENAQKMTHIGAWKLNASTNMLSGSDELFDIFDLKRQEDLPLDTLLNSIHPEDREWVADRTKFAVEFGARSDIEYRIVTAQGKEKWARGVSGPAIGEDGKTTELIGAIQDITRQKQIEAELTQHRGHLEKLIEMRTKKLLETQDELMRKERLATLGQLTATVSHELRNPLGAMRPSLFIIDKKSDRNDETVQRAIARIDRNIDRCDRIIDELLDYTRITQLHRQPIEVDLWLDSTLNELDIPQGIQVEKNFSLKDVELKVDVDRLHRVIINVVDNACQSMQDEDHEMKVQKGSRLSIKTEHRDKHIAIAIADTGCGMPEDVQSRIFEPLFSTKGFGVGLGMPTVKQIMEQHGGGTEIDSKPGAGTTVTLWLPLSTVAKNNTKPKLPLYQG